MKSHKELNELQQCYATLEKQYKQLLEKNQNDLIAIRKKQKAMNAIIDELKNDKEKIKLQLSEQIAILKAQIEKLMGGSSKKRQIQNSVSSALKISSYKSVKHSNQDNQNNDIKLKNMTSKFENLSQEHEKVLKQNKKNLQAIQILKNDFLIQIEKNKLQESQYQQLETELSKTIGVKTQLENYFDQQKKRDKTSIQQLNKQIEKLRSLEDQYSDLQQRFVKYQQEAQNQLEESRRKEEEALEFVRKKEDDMKILQQELQTLKSKNMCNNCIQMEKQAELHKQMLKSVQTMLRVKQIEVQRYKNSHTALLEMRARNIQ